MSGKSLTSEALEEAIAEASKTFDVVRSNGYDLLCDLDSHESKKQFWKVLKIVQEKYPVEAVETWYSKSKNTHARIILSTYLDINVRIALQASLGSDGVREVLNLQQVANGCIDPILLFRPKNAEIKRYDIKSEVSCESEKTSSSGQKSIDPIELTT